MKSVFGLSLLLLLTQLSAAAAPLNPCEVKARKAAAGELRASRFMRDFPNPHIYSLSLADGSASCSTGTCTIAVELGDISGSDTSGTYPCVVTDACGSPKASCSGADM